MIGQIIGSLGGLAASYIDGKTAVKKAEAETKMKIATGEISWEQAAIEASNNSWKDEAWTVAFIAIVLGSFIPGIQPYMAQGLLIWTLRRSGSSGRCMQALRRALASAR